MLDVNAIRAELAQHLSANASQRHSLDAALMHVVQLAYQQGMKDAESQRQAAKVTTAPGYDAWRVSYQSSEQAARAAYSFAEALRAELREKAKPAVTAGPLLRNNTATTGPAVTDDDGALWAWLRDVLNKGRSIERDSRDFGTDYVHAQLDSWAAHYLDFLRALQNGPFDFLEEQARDSRTGVFVDWAPAPHPDEPGGYRVTWRRFQGPRATTLREAFAQARQAAGDA